LNWILLFFFGEELYMKSTNILFVLIFSFGYHVILNAATVSGTLGTSATMVDSYSFSCPTGTVSSRIRVMDLNGIRNSLASVFASFGEKGSPTLTVSDSESTSTGSAFVTNTVDGPGLYSLVVVKSASGTEDYSVEVQCLNSQGASLAIAAPLIKTNQ
jgi:hypothetical protein